MDVGRWVVVGEQGFPVGGRISETLLIPTSVLTDPYVSAGVNFP